MVDVAWLVCIIEKWDHKHCKACTDLEFLRTSQDFYSYVWLMPTSEDHKPASNVHINCLQKKSEARSRLSYSMQNLSTIEKC